MSALQERLVTTLMPQDTVVHRVGNPISVPQRPFRFEPPGDFLFVGRISMEKGAPILAGPRGAQGCAPSLSALGRAWSR